MNRLWLFAVGCWLLATLPAAAADINGRRGCRAGRNNPHAVLHRAKSLQADENVYVGERRQLVVLASFQDQDFAADDATTLELWDRIFNEEGFNEDMFVGSVHDYFMAQSYGQFNLSFDLKMVELPGNLKKYRSTADVDENSQYMVDDIVDVLQTQGIDWAQYDWDGDKFVDQLLIIYAGRGQNIDGNSNTIWPHQWWLSLHLNLETDDEEDFRSYRTVNSGSEEYYIDKYCCVQEVVNSGDLKSSFGTICHEYSHCFGFPDFYYGAGKIVEKWDLMDYGNFNGGGYRPCGYSAHERMLMGWLNPIELTSTASIQDMQTLEYEPEAYLIRNDGAENEYYIIENRQQKGWDENLPGSGILVFHIEYDKQIWEGTEELVNSYSKKRYSIIPANNNSRAAFSYGWAYPYMDNDSLTNTSMPAATLNIVNIDGTKLMSKPVTKMSVDADGQASFAFMLDETVGIGNLPQPKSAVMNAIYNISGIQLSTKPQAGLYIQRGKKFVAK